MERKSDSSKTAEARDRAAEAREKAAEAAKANAEKMNKVAKAQAEKVGNAAKALHKYNSGFIKEFLEFINRGNVVDLAVGVAVGTAFTAIVNSLVNDIVMPIVGAILFGVDFNNLKITIPYGNNPEINVGSFLQNILQFLVIAFVVFLVVRFMNRLIKVREKAAEKRKPSDDAKK